MSYGRRGIKKKPLGSQDMTLNIASMVDIFSVLLIFLLKSYAGGDFSVSPSSGLQLPVAGTPKRPKAALVLEISETGVRVDNEFTVGLSKFKFEQKDLLASGIPAALNKTLEKQRKRQDLIAQANPDVKKKGTILVVADQRTPYITVRRVISTAAIHGFNEPKLVVVTRE